MGWHEGPSWSWGGYARNELVYTMLDTTVIKNRFEKILKKVWAAPWGMSVTLGCDAG